MRALLLATLLLAPAPVLAQDDATLADIRQELQVLYVEVQRLRRELSTTGAPAPQISGTGALERIDAMEAEMRRLTGLTERLQNRIDRVVADGTNRVGDLEFRLCELEQGCDVSTLGDTPTLGGSDGAPPAPVRPTPVTEGTELAMGEQDDFDRARAAFEEGRDAEAAEAFAAFAEAYTGGPLTGQAHFLRGRALARMGDSGGAARAYLEAFSGQPEGPFAPDALLGLGRELAALGQQADACATLSEVPGRFPDRAGDAQQARAEIGCQ